MNKKLIGYLWLFITGLFLLFSTTSFAQNPQTKASGKIMDASKVTIIGATVIEKGTTNGTLTNGEGQFELVLTKTPATLQVRMVGYKTLEIPAGSNMEIELEEDVQSLQEVVVIGYGTVKKEDLTGSVSTIKAEDLNRGVVTSSYDLLRGKVSGVYVSPDQKIRIRGASSLNASNDPLIVVDGVPLSYNGLSSINPEDIETFTVLKDASSAAIYGSRAAGGVILITTKKPDKNQKVKVSYTTSFSIRNYIGETDVLSADEFRAKVRDIYANSPTNLALANSLMGDENNDWISKVTQTGFVQTHNLALSGTVLKGHLPYRASVGYIQERGNVKGDWSKKPSVLLNLSPNFMDNHIALNLSAKAFTDINDDNKASYRDASNYNPTLPAYFYNPDGSIDYTTNHGFWVNGNGQGENFVPASNAETNPLQYKRKVFDRREYYGYVLNGDINYKLHGFEDLSFKLSVGIDGRDDRTTENPYPGYWALLNDGIAPGVGTYYMDHNYKQNKMLESYASYNHDFSGHQISAIAGYSWQHFYYRDTNERRLAGNYDNDASNIHYIKDDVYGKPYDHGEEHYLVSFYSRLNYSFLSRYLLTLTLRNDGSSRFSEEKRWGLFPSAALAWNLKEEKFLKNSRLFSQLKLRTGWGITGQESGIANYSYMPNYILSSDNAYRYNMGAEGLFYNLRPAAYDPNIKWEETTTVNAGLDFGVLDGRLSGSFDVYKRTTKDLLNEVKIPLGANFSNSLLTNIGSIENKGVEIALDYYPIRNADMSFNIGLTGTFENTEFTKLTIGDDKINKDYYIPTESIGVGTGGYIQQQRVGYAPRTFYPYKQVYDANGHPIQNAFVDGDGNGIIDDNDRYLSDKKPTPDFFYGIILKFRYKNWDLGLNGHGSKGNWAFNNYARANATTASDNLNYNRLRNFHRAVNKTGWSSTNIDAQHYSDLWLEDASFFKIDDLNLGYTFNIILKKQGTSLRLAASVNNVLLITNYSGVEPEIGLNGIDGRFDPRRRTYTLRAMLNF
jgi:iron complex outermembrane receptor protein